jgi:hypothetical protein
MKLQDQRKVFIPVGEVMVEGELIIPDQKNRKS